MITVNVDGNPLAADITDIKRMGDLIELVKATIDPDTIVTSIKLDGTELSESDWRTPLSAFSGKTLSVGTGSKEEYVGERLGLAEQYIRQIVNQFDEAGALYLQGSTDQGNAMLKTSVDDLLAFVNWYATMLSIRAADLSDKIEEFSSHVEEIQKICEDLLEQQLYQSWQVLGQTLQEKLKPELDRLKEFCVATAGG